MTDDEKFMRECIKEAKKCLKYGDVPVGAIVVKDGEIIAHAHNEREKTNLSTSHAEVLAINRASRKLNNWNLSGCVLYVTLEPCVMCAGAIISARLSRVCFGAYDLRFGCCGTLYNLLNDRFNHRAPVSGGVLKDECEALLKDFFGAVRRGQEN
jgi:tRNA(adenine34) deaminase